MANEENELASVTKIMIFCFIPIHCLFCLFLICFLIVSSISTTQFPFAGAIIHEIVLISGVIGILKLAVSTIHDECEAKKSRRLRNEMVIGLVGIALCQIVPMILVFFIEFEETQVLTFLFRCNMTSIQLYLLFVMECDNLLKLDKNYESTYLRLTIINFILLAIITIFCWVYGNEQPMCGIVWFQYLFSLLLIPSTMDLYGFLSGHRKMRENVDGENDLRNECKICLLEFNQIQTIPRILVTCGHTICQICVEKLLRQNNGQRVICPHCQKPTPVYGSATFLPKNFALLDAVEGKKK